MRFPPPRQSGVVLALAALACFAALDTTTQFVSAAGVPVLMALWFRYVFQAVSATAVVLPQRGWAAIRTAHPRFQLLRGVLLAACSALAFLSLKYMPVAEFTAVVMITPIVVTLLAATTLNERVSPLRWLLVLGGFAGVMVILRPSREDFNWTLLLPLGLVAANAWFQVLTSKLARLESPITMQLYSGWVGLGLTTLALPFVWASVSGLQVWTALLFMGFAATVGHFLLIQAYAAAPAATLTPYLYAQIVFATLGGWLVFSYVPDQVSMLGMLLIGLCGALSAWLTRLETRIVPEPVES